MRSQVDLVLLAIGTAMDLPAEGKRTCHTTYTGACGIIVHFAELPPVSIVPQSFDHPRKRRSVRSPKSAQSPAIETTHEK